jgi:hypothetical protein
MIATVKHPAKVVDSDPVLACDPVFAICKYAHLLATNMIGSRKLNFPLCLTPSLTQTLCFRPHHDFASALADANGS